MNKLHTLLLVFSAMTSAKIWADGPELQGSALQAPELNTSSATKESPFKKLMALLAKAKQQKAQGPVAPSLQASAPTQTISSAQDLVSLIRSQGLSFKDALEKMGMGVSKRFSKRLDGKRGQRVFLKKIKKEGLSWQDAAASLKPAAPAEVAPLSSTTCPPGSPFDDFENFLKANYTTDNAGALLAALVDSWQSLVGDFSNVDAFSHLISSNQLMEDKILNSALGALQKKYAGIVDPVALQKLLDFKKALVLKQESDVTNLSPEVVNTVFNAIKTRTDDLSKQLKQALTTDFQKAYRLVEKSLSRDDFDNADSASTKDNIKTPDANTAVDYTGLTDSGAKKTSALKSLQEALDFSMTRQGLNRLIYGNKSLTSMSLYDGKGSAAVDANTAATKLFADKNIQWACSVVNNGTATPSTALLNQEVALIDSLITATSYLGDYIPAAGTNKLDTVKGVYSAAITPTPAEVLKNQGFTLKLLAAASDDSIADHYELTPAEKTGAYCLRQLLNRKTLPTLRSNDVYNSPAPEDAEDNLENRRNRMEEGQENRSESRSARPNNRNNIVWEN